MGLSLLLTALHTTVRGDPDQGTKHLTACVRTLALGQPLPSSGMFEADSSFNIIKPPSITGTVCHCWQQPLLCWLTSKLIGSLNYDAPARQGESFKTALRSLTRQGLNCRSHGVGMTSEDRRDFSVKLKKRRGGGEGFTHTGCFLFFD